MWKFIIRIIWTERSLAQRVGQAIAFGLPQLAAILSPYLGGATFHWTHLTLIGFAALSFIIAWHCLSKAYAYELEKQPVFKHNVQWLENNLQLSLKNASSRSIENCCVKVRNQRTLDGSMLIEMQKVLTPLDGGPSRFTIDPNDWRYFNFARIARIRDQETLVIGPDEHGKFYEAAGRDCAVKIGITFKDIAMPVFHILIKLDASEARIASRHEAKYYKNIRRSNPTPRKMPTEVILDE
ncbi:MAG: hypothetical protein ACK4FJ_00580 [Ferrovibrio sp.]|uniref:hypothetical protein n=1 Tax=Ferrovibrio sp. TaxID=1917215 RepID=UPI003918AC2B